MKSSISVLTIVKDRLHALENLIKGLESNTWLPQELVIVHMNEPVREFHSDFFPIRSFQINAEHSLPLAAARNRAVACARFSHLIFIDVDCIPAVDLVKQYANAFDKNDHLWTGPVRYLPRDATASNDFLNQLDRLSEPDPIRGNLGTMTYELFWSLNFGCSRLVYKRLGGFDLAFQGYGAEDTDFSFSARLHGVPIATTQAVAYHQYHPSYDPPLNHLEDIVMNATVFFKKWNVWPMEGWLKKFSARGLIDWQDGSIQIIRYPQQHEIDSALKL